MNMTEKYKYYEKMASESLRTYPVEIVESATKLKSSVLELISQKLTYQEFAMRVDALGASVHLEGTCVSASFCPSGHRIAVELENGIVTSLYFA